jgi:hypothetical protein
MIRTIGLNTVNTIDEADAAWFFMEWCNRPDFETFRSKKNNEIIVDILIGIENDEYDIELFIDEIIGTERFEREYDEFKNMLDGKRQLAKLKINDLLDNDFERLRDNL